MSTLPTAARKEHDAPAFIEWARGRRDELDPIPQPTTRRARPGIGRIDEAAYHPRRIRAAAGQLRAVGYVRGGAS